MIDPTDVTKFDRTQAELEEWWLFSVLVAGKTAATQARLLERFLTSIPKKGSPFEKVASLASTGALEDHMKEARLGQYSRLVPCFTQSLALDLRNDPIEAFEAIHGVGPKTARMFLMHSRPNQRLAAIDTHVLKHLREKGFAAPKTTPPAGKLYRKLEEQFLMLADEAGESPADYDLRVWKSYAAIM
jgi:hypothetical protein